MVIIYLDLQECYL